jgi:hypothetical protein
MPDQIPAEWRYPIPNQYPRGQLTIVSKLRDIDPMTLRLHPLLLAPLFWTEPPGSNVRVEPRNQWDRTRS